MNGKRINRKTSPPPAEHALSGELDVWDMTNRYGTYNTQNTNGIQNDYPQIGQGAEAPHDNKNSPKLKSENKKTK